MNKKQHLPVFGVGPLYVIFCLIMTVLGVFLNKWHLLDSGKLQNMNFALNIVGAIFVIAGVSLWISAVIFQKINIEIKKGNLVTSGVYSIVRNPVYSAFLLIFTGILITTHNIYLLILPVLFYIILTVLMKYTEEKWLFEKFGEEYVEYCSKVNRCIPWIPKR